MTELDRAREILAMMLACDFEGAEQYRQQLKVATLTRPDTGCSIEINRTRAPAAPYDPRFPGAKLPVEAFGHGKLWIMLHGFEGYLDSLGLLNRKRFLDPAEVKVALDWRPRM